MLNHKIFAFDKLFIYTMLFLSIAFLSLILSGHLNQRAVFFSNTNDFFMDHFNNLKYISERDPYHCSYLSLAEKIYPPIAYLILYPFSKLFPYANGGLPVHARMDQLSIVSLVLLLAFLSIIFAAFIYELKKGSKTTRWLTVFSLLLSGIFLFSIERANIVILSAILLACFFLFDRSSNNAFQEIALIALALAINLKVYPIFFTLIFLYQRRYRELLRISIYTILLFILPFLFFKNGFSNISQLINNARLNTMQYMFSGPMYRFGFIPVTMLFFHQSAKVTGANIAMIVSVCYLFITCGTAWIFHKYWKTVMILTCAVIATPVNSGFYTGLYFFIPVILFLNEETHERKDWAYLVLIVIVLNPLQFTINNVEIASIVSNCALLAIYTLLCADGVSHFWYYLRNISDSWRYKRLKYKMIETTLQL